MSQNNILEQIVELWHWRRNLLAVWEHVRTCDNATVLSNSVQHGADACDTANSSQDIIVDDRNYLPGRYYCVAHSTEAKETFILPTETSRYFSSSGSIFSTPSSTKEIMAASNDKVLGNYESSQEQVPAPMKTSTPTTSSLCTDPPTVTNSSTPDKEQLVVSLTDIVPSETTLLDIPRGRRGKNWMQAGLKQGEVALHSPPGLSKPLPLTSLAPLANELWCISQWNGGLDDQKKRRAPIYS